MQNKTLLEAFKPYSDYIASIGYSAKILEVDSLDEIQKLSVYMHFFIKNRMIDLTHGKNINPINIPCFSDFINEKNIELRNHGEDWREKGFAQKRQIELHGIYDYYWKFKNEIKLA